MQNNEKVTQSEKEMLQSFGSGKYEHCLYIADKILQLDPTHFNARCYKGTSLEKVGHYRKALKIINQCLKEHHDLFFLWVTRGDCHYGLEEWENAFNDYFTALPLDENNGAIMDKCARCLFRLGDANYALHFIQQATNKAESPEPFIVMITMLNRIGLTDYAQQVVYIGANTFPDDDRFIKLMS